MKRALFLLTLLPVLALAQPKPPSSGCKLSATACTAAKALTGTNTGDVTIGAVGSTPDAKTLSISGQVITAQPADLTHPGHISLSAQTMGDGAKSFNGAVLLVSDESASLGSTSKRWVNFYGNGIWNQSARVTFAGSSGNFYIDSDADDALAVSHTFKTGNALTTTGGKLVSVQNLATEKLAIDKDGNITAAGTGVTANPVPVVHAAQTTSAVAMEFGRSAATAGGALAVTFATAFGAAPSCVCTDENAVPVICGITTAPSTTAVTFSITAARADTVDWQCIGAK